MNIVYKDAVNLLKRQDRNIRKVNNTRFVDGGYEYRVTYRGGFASYVAIDRRKVGKRNFEYFGGIGAYNMWTVGEVMDAVMQKVRSVA